jgi:molybdopterin molybdotransferase
MTIKPKRLIDDCFLHDKDRLRHDEAIAILKERLGPVVGISTKLIADVTGRVLAENIQSPDNVPMHNNAAVDGYAYQSQDFDAVNGYFPVSSRIVAGDQNILPLPENSAARIFTGAAMPANADTVVMQEDCKTSSSEGMPFVKIPPGLKPGANWRKAGEDLTAGEMVLPIGQQLRPQDIAAIASTGKNKVQVFDQLRIGLISTGDELRRPGIEINHGEVYDSNHFLLNSLLQTCNAKITDYGIIEDREDIIRSVMEETAGSNDVIITTGGASRGEEDHIITALDTIGKRHMWQMAIKPGRPMVFGQIPGQEHDCLFFGLPGNPVAVMVCFLMYVRPSLGKLSGGNWKEPNRYTMPAMFEIKQKKPDRREFLRGILAKDDNGNIAVLKFQKDGSGLISSLRQSDGLIEITEDITELNKGDMVGFIPFSEFGII